MKKIYGSFIGLLAVGSFTAQVNKSNVSPLLKKNASTIETTKKSSSKPISQTEKATILWSDDFDAATPGNWVINTTGTNTAGWEFKTGDYDFNSTPPFTTLESATAANGYLMVNSDKFGGGGANADTDGTRITTTVTTAAAITACSSEPFVRLRFEHNFRWWHDSRGVRISPDNGVTWVDYALSNDVDYNLDDATTADTTEGHYNGGQSSVNPQITTIDISSVAGNASQVLIQFYYDDNDWWGWYWAIDDVSIEVLEDYDLTLVSPYWGALGAWGERIGYYKIPATQVAPVEFSGGVKNNGAQIQSGVTVSTTIGATTLTSAPVQLIQAQLDTLDCAGTWTPSTGSNTINMSTESSQTDAFAEDNALAFFDLNVGGFIYSRDNGIPANGTFNGGDGFEAGNIFDMYAPATLQGIDVHISGASEPGAEIFAKIYSVDADGAFVFLNDSEPYVLTDLDLDTTITLPLISETDLNAGEPYLVVVGSFGDGGSTNDLVIATSGTSNKFTSYYFDMTEGASGTWFYTLGTPMVRMNFDPSVGIKEVENIAKLTVFPNPANTTATVSFDVVNDAEVSVTVTDLSGKVVYTNDLGSVKGAQKVTLNTEVLNSGVYMVNVTMNGAVSTKKLVVKK
jgi:hypothetical protein